MFSHHILPALAYERRKALLAEAGTSAARRSPLGWLPNWLRPDRSRWRSRPLHQPAVEDDDPGAVRLGAGQLKFSCQPPANCGSPRMDADADATMTARPVTRPGVCADVRDGRAGGGVAHRPRRAARGEAVALRDGSKVLIRQVQGTDAPLLADGFTRLSAQSRQMRFLTRKKELSRQSCAISPTSTTTTTRRSAHWTTPTGAAWASPATSGTPTTRRPPRSPSPSSTIGRAGGWPPNC